MEILIVFAFAVS